MDKQVKRDWVAALRSGEYTQGAGALRRGDTYCCLGVLCEIYRKAVGGHWPDVPKLGRFSFYSKLARFSFCSFEGANPTLDYLPDPVREWAGLTTASGRLPGGSNLAEMNDNGKTFAEIADLIEAEL